MSRIIVTEYPKSGGTWITSLLGDTLHYDKRDIYVGNGFNLFDISKHPWYEGLSDLNITDDCVIKSHELPDSRIVDFPAKYIHLIRDGRDVVTSKYFYEHDFCVKNMIYDAFFVPFDDYLTRVTLEWKDYILCWLERSDIICKYEDFLSDPATTLKFVIERLDLEASVESINLAITLNTKDKIRKALDKTFEHNTFVRKGESNDWKNYFSEFNKAAFKKIAGDVLITLNYEKSLDW